MKKAVVVAGLAFGDESKGSVTDFLARRYNAHLVVRYNGGPQAAHHVVADNLVQHTFSQFASGTLAGAGTFLSKYMLVEPFALKREAAVLESEGVRNPLGGMSIDPECVVVTPYHQAANRIREAARGNMRHGSVGLGVGEARQDELEGLALRVKDLKDGEAYGDSFKILSQIRALKLMQLAEFQEDSPYRGLENLDVENLQAFYSSFYRTVSVLSFTEAADRAETVVFEGAQGVLLDETHGFAPFNTWTDCTFRNANRLIEEAGVEDVMRVGVLRSYFTRHGPGPFPTEAQFVNVPEIHNGLHPYMGAFRVGHFDAVLTKYALRCCPGIDCLAITHLDRAPSHLICTGYEQWDGKFTAESLFQAKPVYSYSPGPLAERIADLLGVPVRFESRGMKTADKTEVFAAAGV